MTDDTKRQKTLRSLSEDCEPHGKKEVWNFQELSRKLAISKDEAEGKSRRNPKHNMIHGKGKGKEIMHDHEDERWPNKGTLELQIPFHPPPASPTKMRLLKMSKLFGMQPKKFDPKTYVEEEEISNDSSSRRHIHSKKNVVRWREVTNPDGTVTLESNARFVRWSDGSLQLIIGKEALDVREEGVPGIQQLFLLDDMGILQCQGRVLQKLIVTPTSMPSKSHPSSTPLIHIPQKKKESSQSGQRCAKFLDPDWFIGGTKKAEKQKKKVRLTKCSNRSNEGNAMIKHMKKKTNKRLKQE